MLLLVVKHHAISQWERQNKTTPHIIQSQLDTSNNAQVRGTQLESLYIYSTSAKSSKGFSYNKKCIAFKTNNNETSH